MVGHGLVPLIAVGFFLFWLWVLVDCLTKEPSFGNQKLVWALVILLLYVIGAFVYVFARRPSRIRELGA